MSQEPETRGSRARVDAPKDRRDLRVWALAAALAFTVTPVAADEIRAAVESFVAAQTQDIGASRTIEVGNLDTRVRLARCEDGLRVFFAPGSLSGSRRTVGVSCPGPKPWTIYVSARVTHRGEVLVATRNLPRGAVLAESDLASEERNIEEGPSGYLTEPAQAVGKRTIRPLRFGRPATSGALEDVQVIERGQRVWLLAQSRALSVRMSGTALEGGTPGDRIRVQNDASKRVVQGLVGEDGSIRVGM
jgi:flagella basal body P-ring formation protein FlgA